MNEQRLRVRRRLRLAWVAVAILVAFPAIASAGPLGRCIRADVPAEVVLPDGTVGGPGPLRICYRNAFSPVLGLQEISLDGTTIGLFASRTSPGQRPEHERLLKIHGDRPYMIFLRNGGGQLVLLSYHSPVGDEVWSHVLLPSKNPEVRSYWRVATGSSDVSEPIDVATLLDRDDTLVLEAVAP